MMHINSLKIQNFKSIKDLILEPKRVNVFIGEPNSGKTNIIEAMSLLSIGSMQQSFINEVLRFDSFDELFPDSDISHPILVYSDNLRVNIRYNKTEQGASHNNFKVE